MRSNGDSMEREYLRLLRHVLEHGVRKNDPVILICRAGNRTDAPARHLVEQMGCAKVYSVRDGITARMRDGRAVSRILG